MYLTSRLTTRHLTYAWCISRFPSRRGYVEQFSHKAHFQLWRKNLPEHSVQGSEWDSLLGRSLREHSPYQVLARDTTLSVGLAGLSYKTGNTTIGYGCCERFPRMLGLAHNHHTFLLAPESSLNATSSVHLTVVSATFVDAIGRTTLDGGLRPLIAYRLSLTVDASKALTISSKSGAEPCTSAATT